MYESTVPGGAIYVCHVDSAGNDFRGAMNAAGWSIRQYRIWIKNQFVMSVQILLLHGTEIQIIIVERLTLKTFCKSVW